MKVIYGIRSLFLTIASILGAFCILVFGASLVMGLTPEIVISGSMAPDIPTGALIFAKKVPAAEAKIGDVVTVPRRSGDGLVTHRVVEIAPLDQGVYELTLKGDANETNDPYTYKVKEVGEIVFTVPVLGKVAALFQTRFGILAVIIVVTALAAAFFLRPPEETDDDSDDDPEDDPRRSRRDDPDGIPSEFDRIIGDHR